MRPPGGSSLLGEGLRLGRSRVVDTGQILPANQPSSFHSSARSTLRQALNKPAAPRNNIFQQLRNAVTSFLNAAPTTAVRQAATPLSRSFVQPVAPLHTSSQVSLRYSAVRTGGYGRFSSHQVGLGTARNFSSGAGRRALDNVVQNAPMWLRAAADEAGDMKGTGKSGNRRRRTLISIVKEEERRAAGLPPKQMEKYFAPAVVEESKEEMEVVEITTLTVPLEPSFTLGSGATTSAIHSVLLPSPSSLVALHSVYSIHSLRLYNLESKLRSAGLWDQADFVEWDFEAEGGKSMRMGWKKRKNRDGQYVGLSKADVERKLGMWEGEERWFNLTTEQPAPSTSQSSLRSVFEEPLEASSCWVGCESSNPSRSSSELDFSGTDSTIDLLAFDGYASITQEEHDLTSSTFRFPEPDLSFSSPELTPTQHSTPLLLPEHESELDSLEFSSDSDGLMSRLTSGVQTPRSEWMEGQESYQRGLREFLLNLDRLDGDRAGGWNE
ncbi:hypothetical protein BT69DRAFT_1296784 [Atractiella rhizophila]|nr:hypothetical protein BT69DRAFT_1296784 [Atractiella rhizophila]